MTKHKVTPLMQQYFQIKKEHPDTMLLFQVGDFYELFFDDARTATAYLGIALTKRGKHLGEPVPLCGVPSHALDYYLVKLVKGGFRVALCQQLEAAQAGKVVKRGVTQVFTPGTLTDSQLLDDKSASYLLTFFPVNNAWGVIFSELMTAQLYA
ncbi:DNA mismatch repair protein MutS, partial [bacterium]|nr:DNA mismatch repair protein MutS [bacterium]